MAGFILDSTYKPKGDQPKAISALVTGIKNMEKYQTLLGVTGSGKTFTIANVIEAVQKPTLIMSHNKTLAANYMVNSSNYSRKTLWNILSLIMITTNQKHICQLPIHLLKKRVL